jgi:hypothetical protein
MPFLGRCLTPSLASRNHGRWEWNQDRCPGPVNQVSEMRRGTILRGAGLPPVVPLQHRPDGTGASS